MCVKLQHIEGMFLQVAIPYKKISVAEIVADFLGRFTPFTEPGQKISKVCFENCDTMTIDLKSASL